MSSNLVRLITKKRDGQPLESAEIQALIEAYTSGDFPDFQMAAFAMAVFLNGMTVEETSALTDAMLHSGAVMQWPEGSPVVDKHSTGGIGDKVSLPLAAMLAACGLRVPMISGRGLGPTGGTLDKLESIFGFRTDLSLNEIGRLVEQVGCVITGASSEIAPADRKLYALRDVTGTVPSIPLITASIMSKKMAEGLDALVLDVKVGAGAFMKDIESARQLAHSLVSTGNRLGVKTRCLITDMHQPLGRMIGNAVEVDESLAALRGEGPEDLMEVTLALGAELLVATGEADTLEAAREKLAQTIAAGTAMQKFEEMVRAQAGRLDAPRPRGPVMELTAESSGYVHAIENEQLGWGVIDLGGGRKLLSDKIDHSVGLEMLVRIGDPIEAGQPWLRIFCPTEQKRLDAALLKLKPALIIAETPPPAGPLVVETLD